jgi:uncharacterized membrane protein
VSGSYGFPDDRKQYAFTASGATITTLTVSPETMSQWANAISNDGKVVGGYRDSNDNNQAFSAFGSTVTLLSYPDVSTLDAYGINSSGHIVGNASSVSDSYSFFFNGTSASALAVPGAPGTYAYGINDSDTVVGSYYDSNFVQNGFIWNGTTFTTFNVPGAVNGTVIKGISNDGKMAGTWYDADFRSHGWVWDGVTFTNVDSASVTEAVWGVGISGINDSGQFVGYYTDANFNQPSFIGQLDGGPSAVPEPGTAVLLLGAFAVAGAGRKMLRRS